MPRHALRPTPGRAGELLALSAALVAVAAGLAACGPAGASASSAGASASSAGGTTSSAVSNGSSRSATSRRASAAPAGAPLPVAVSAYPLAQLVSYIGAADVRVTDLAPPGAQPQDLTLGPGQRAALRSAALVIVVGDGYQPAVEAAAKSAHRYLAILPAVSSQAQPYEFWLDPYLMAKASAVIASALTAADPSGRQQFHNGTLDFQSVADSIESDFESTFTQCNESYFVTADDAFGRMATAFGLVDVAISRAGANAATTTLSAHNLTAVFSEVGVPSGPLEQVARRAAVSIKSLNPMELAPAAGANAPSYFSAMEQDLTAMEGPLDCDTTDNYS